MGQIQHNVVVHKAAIQLKSGESLRDYTKALSDAGKAHVALKRNISGSKDYDVYMVEAFSKAAIFEVYRFGPLPSPTTKRFQYYAVEYTRKDNGDFEFTGTTEVERVTRFEPKSATPVTKSRRQSFGEGSSQWQETGGSFWGGAA